MNKIATILTTLMILLFAGSSLAFTPPPAPDNGWFVRDQASKLQPAEIDALNHKIKSLKQTTKNEFGVLILKSLDGADLFDAAQTTFRSWGIGDAKLNNGVLLLISVVERKTRLHTGKGVEGDLPDLLCSDILANTLKPHLKKGDFYGGIDATLDELASHLESRAKTSSAPQSSTSTPLVASGFEKTDSGSYIGATILFFGFLILVGGIIGVAFLVSWLGKRKADKEFEAAQKKWDRSREEDRIFKRSMNDGTNFYPTPHNQNVAPHFPPPPPKPASHSGLKTAAVVGGAVVGGTLLADEVARKKRADERKREEDARKRRNKEDDRARRRRNDDSSYSSSSSSYSSSSWDSGSSSSSWDSGSSFGGGDSGGGGSDGSF